MNQSALTQELSIMDKISSQCIKKFEIFFSIHKICKQIHIIMAKYFMYVFYAAHDTFLTIKDVYDK